MQTLVQTILTYDCESYTLNAAEQLQAFKMKCLWRIPNTSYREQKTTLMALQLSKQWALQRIKKRRLSWFGQCLQTQQYLQWAGARYNVKVWLAGWQQGLDTVVHSRSPQLIKLRAEPSGMGKGSGCSGRLGNGLLMMICHIILLTCTWH